MTNEDRLKVDDRGRTFLHYLCDEQNTLEIPEVEEIKPDIKKRLKSEIDYYGEEVNMKDNNGDTPITLAVRDMLLNKSSAFGKMHILLLERKQQEINRKNFDEAFDIYMKEVRPILIERYKGRTVKYGDEDWFEFNDFLSGYKSTHEYLELKMTDEERNAIEAERKRKAKEEREARKAQKEIEEEFIKNNPCKSDDLRNGGRGHCSPDMDCPWCAVPENREYSYRKNEQGKRVRVDENGW